MSKENLHSNNDVCNMNVDNYRCLCGSCMINCKKCKNKCNDENVCKNFNNESCKKNCKVECKNTNVKDCSKK